MKNVPLSESENEKARSVLGLEEILTTDVEKMSPDASKYWRARRKFLTDEICSSWGVGVRPSRGGADKRGYSLRGNVVYRFLSEENKVLGYIGRDPGYEANVVSYESLVPERRDPKKRPIKHRFPKGFHRGIELYGQHFQRLEDHPEYREFIAQHGILIVEGFNDVLSLDHCGVPAVALCSNQMTEQQASKIIRWAKHIGNGKVSLMLDCQDTGDEGAKSALWHFAQTEPHLDVRLAWSQSMSCGAFKGRQPESLSHSELHEILLPTLRR